MHAANFIEIKRSAAELFVVDWPPLMDMRRVCPYQASRQTQRAPNEEHDWRRRRPLSKTEEPHRKEAGHHHANFV